MGKFLLVVAVAAYVKAEAEADPAFVYSTAGVLPYAHGVVPYALHTPLVYTAAAGCQNNAGQLVPCAHGALPLVAGVAPVAAQLLLRPRLLSLLPRERLSQL